jgi:hypothetical protein
MLPDQLPFTTQQTNELVEFVGVGESQVSAKAYQEI